MRHALLLLPLLAACPPPEEDLGFPVSGAWLVRCVNDRGTLLEHLIVASDEGGSCPRATAGPVAPSCALLREGFADQGFCRGGKLPFLGYATELHIVRDPADAETSRAVLLSCDGEEDWDVQDGTFAHEGLDRRRVRVDVRYGEDGAYDGGTVTAEWCGMAGDADGPR